MSRSYVDHDISLPSNRFTMVPTTSSMTCGCRRKRGCSGFTSPDCDRVGKSP